MSSEKVRCLLRLGSDVYITNWSKAQYVLCVYVCVSESDRVYVSACVSRYLRGCLVSPWKQKAYQLSMLSDCVGTDMCNNSFDNNQALPCPYGYPGYLCQIGSDRFTGFDLSPFVLPITNTMSKWDKWRIIDIAVYRTNLFRHPTTSCDQSNEWIPTYDCNKAIDGNLAT